MGESKKSFRINHERTVPTNTIGAAFILSIVMGLIVISGVLLKPYEAREVVEGIHEKIMMAKEYRELSKMSYSPNKVAYSKLGKEAFPESNVLPSSSFTMIPPLTSPVKAATQKTDRAQSFDRDVKSDEYWKSLQASIANIDSAQPDSAPIVLPPVVVGSAD